MRIEKDYQTSFTSLNNPVKSFRIFTPKGKLFVEEVRLKDKSVKFSFSISKFINDCFIEGADEPLWKEYLKPEKHLLYQGKIERYANYLRNAYKHDDGNTTLLIAKDNKNNIRGAIFSLTYNEPVSLKDNKLCNVDAIAVDKDYRGFHVGKKLLEKTLVSAKKQFSDAVLTSYNKNVPFYKKFGFEILPQDTKKKRYFYSELLTTRNDIPQYTQLMYKPLNLNERRFYDRVKPDNLMLQVFKSIKKKFYGSDI